MMLYLMQHGHAVAEEEDPQRPLSAAGREQIQQSARAVKALGLAFTAMVCSTKLRSKQTAEIVAQAVVFPLADIEETDAVKPSADPGAAAECLRRFPADASVFVAGHMPSLALLASSLLADGGKVSLHFTNGGLCCIEAPALPTHDGVLHWHLTPDHLRRLAAPPAATA
jgi:phosphohistidine phosphatase